MDFPLFIFWCTNILNYFVLDEEGNRSQRSLKVRDLIPNNLGFRVVTEWNERSQPVGKSAGLLAGFLGFTANNFDTFPILYQKWPKVPEGYKNNVYDNTIKVKSLITLIHFIVIYVLLLISFIIFVSKEKFVVNDGSHKTWILSSLGKKWRDNRCKLFKDYYNWELSLEQNLRNPPPGIDEDHWRLFLEYRMKPETMVIRKTLKLNRFGLIL